MRTARILSVEGVNLLFGLDWIPILSEASLARSQARHLRAAWHVLSGEPAAALGLTRAVAARGRFWSAADLWARLHAQRSVACVLPLSPQVWHVLACHQGVTLVRADRSFDRLEQALEAVQDMRLACPELELQSVADPTALQEVLQKLAQRAVPALALQRTRPRWTHWALLVALLGVGAFLWMRANAVSGPTVQDQATTQRLWQHAFDDALSRRPIHGAAGTRALLRGLYQQPVQLAGWGLREVQCEPTGSGQDWACKADYQRQTPDADNRGLLAHAPPDWQLEFPDLDVAQARWQIAVPGLAVRPQALPSATLVARDWASILQASLAAFHALRLEPPQRLPVPAPRDPTGRELPAPPEGLPAISVRTLRIEGPLRSAFLVEPLADAVSWRRVRLSVGAVRHVDLRTSRLTLRLEGILYAIPA